MKRESVGQGVVVLLTAVIITAIVVGTAVYLLMPTAEEKEEKYFIGLAAHSVRNTWEDFYAKSFEWFCGDLDVSCTWTEAGKDIAVQITQAKRLIDMGIDGLIISPMGFEASAAIMDYAEERNVPVICTNADAKSSYPLLFIGYGQFTGTAQIGEKVVDYLKSVNGEAKGKVIETYTAMGTLSQLLRTGGFHSVVDEYPGIEVVQLETHGEREKARSMVYDALLANPDVQVIYGQNCATCLGAVGAIEELGLSFDDLYIATLDAAPAVLTAIEEGKIDIALDQPCAYYNPLAVYYMVKYLDEGADAIPKPGETITADMVPIDELGQDHLGINPWATPYWAPAQVVSVKQELPDQFGTEDHPWLITNVIWVDKNNYQLPFLWGNAPLPGW